MADSFDDTSKEAPEFVTTRAGFGAHTQNDTKAINGRDLTGRSEESNTSEQLAVETVSDAEIGCPQRRKPATRPRKDKKRLHATRHAVLSRYPLEALARRGVNIRQLRRIERMLRAELKPTGIIAEILFDRAWSSYLRCLLIALAETHLFAPVDSRLNSTRTPQLQELELPTLVWLENNGSLVNLSVDLLKHLSIVQRYDNHFSREFFRAIDMLIAMRSGGEAGLTRQIEKTLGQIKDIYEDLDGK
jgi:hypothetical protein